MDPLEKKEYVAMNTAVDQSYRGRRLGAGRVMALKSWFGYDHCDAPMMMSNRYKRVLRQLDIMNGQCGGRNG